MAAYYNEIDPYAAEWLRTLIMLGHIADGEVDTRSISEIEPHELRRFTQCHFFAGIGGWSHALRLAGWPDDRPVWTGSCPCQPFSVAGRGAGVADERHLWPHWFHLIAQCRPRVVFGEQVEAAIRHGWLDLVQDDLEGIGYAVAPIGLPAACVGAPHIRQRLWFVADAVSAGRAERGTGAGRGPTAGDGSTDRLAHSGEQGPQGRGAVRQRGDERAAGEGGVAFWSDAEWIWCRDGKWRPVEPLPQQMADGFSQSMGRLRADQIQEFEEEVTTHANAHETDIREALFNLWLSLAEEAIQRETRGLSSVREAPVLLAFLRQLADEGWEIAQGLPRASTQDEEGHLRMLWGDEEASRAPHKRGLDGQPSGEHSNLVRVLSSVLARHAQACWGETFARHASDAFPLTTGAPARVGRLRAYGNAIVPQVAAEVISAYMAVV